LLLPLFVSRQFYFPYILPRVIVFRTIVEIIFFLWLILVLKDRKYLPPRNTIFWSLLILTAVFVITTFTSVDPSQSFFGTMERGGGVFTWLHYFAFFVVLTGVFKQWKDWVKFFNAAVGAGLLVSLYALAQRLGLSSVYESGIDRATGTIGNAAFLSSYLILASGLILALLFIEKKYAWQEMKWKVFYYSALFFNLLAIYLSETRGAVLGVLAGFFFFAVFYLIFMPISRFAKDGNEAVDFQAKRIKKYIFAFLVIAVIFSTSVFLLRDSAVVKKVPGLSRLASISLQETTAKTRILAWQSAWGGWKEKFLTGWGPENFNIVFNKYFNPEFYNYGRSETWFDRAHNVIFDIGTTSGIAGVLAYLSVFAAAFWLLWKKRKNNFLLAAVVIAVLLAYFVQNLFVFDVINSYLLFVLLLSFVSFFVNYGFAENAFAKNDDSQAGQKRNGKDSQGSDDLGGGAIAGLSVVFLILFLFFWQCNYKALASDYWSAQAFKNANQPQTKARLNDSQQAGAAFDGIIGLYKKTFSYQTYGDPEIRTDFFSFVFDNTENANIAFKGREEGINFALDQMNQNIAEHPLNARWQLLSAKMIEASAQFKLESNQDNKSALADAEKTIKQGIDLSPKKFALHYVLVQILLMQERNQEALAEVQSIITMYPQMPDTYWFLGLAHIAMQDEASALRAIDQAMDYGYNFQNINDLKLAISLLSQKTDLSRLEKAYSQAIVLEPRNLQWYASLATVYSQLGQKDKAIKTANKIIDIDPDSRPDVEEFIKGL